MDLTDLIFGAAMTALGVAALAIGFLTGWRNPYSLPKADEPLTEAIKPWAAAWAAEERALAANGIVRTCRNVRFLARRPRIRARVSWPAAHWIRT
jgi:hypothetical protein